MESSGSALLVRRREEKFRGTTQDSIYFFLCYCTNYKSLHIEDYNSAEHRRGFYFQAEPSCMKQPG